LGGIIGKAVINEVSSTVDIASGEFKGAVNILSAQLRWQF
jgi:hypothetical protein